MFVTLGYYVLWVRIWYFWDYLMLIFCGGFVVVFVACWFVLMVLLLLDIVDGLFKLFCFVFVDMWYGYYVVRDNV